MRTETDTMGEMQVPSDKYYGCQTARSMMNFPIGDEAEKMPVSMLMCGYFRILLRPGNPDCLFMHLRTQYSSVSIRLFLQWLTSPIRVFTYENCDESSLF